MAFRHGRLAELTVNGSAMSTFCDSMDLSIDVDAADTTTFTKSWKTAIAGLAGGSLEISGNYDPTASTGPAAILTALIGADPFTVVAYPGGNTSGQVSRSFSAILTAYKEGSPVGDKVSFSATLMVTDTLTFGTV